MARTFHMTKSRRRVFSHFLKVAKVSELMTLSGCEFQMVGAATEKARLAKTVGVRGTASLGAWLDRGDREELKSVIFQFRKSIQFQLPFYVL